MDINEWFYSNTKNECELVSLNELIQKYNHDELAFDTLVRHSNWIYWKRLNKCSEILAHIKWDYQDQDKRLQKNVFGYEIVSKVLKNELPQTIKVRTHPNGPLISFNKTALLSTSCDEEISIKGLYSMIPSKRTSIEWLFFIFTLIISTIFTKLLPFTMTKYVFLCAVFMMESFLIALNAWLISKRGYSIILKPFKINMLHSNGKKLSFWLAFKRQFINGKRESYPSNYDKDNKIILVRTT